MKLSTWMFLRRLEGHVASHFIEDGDETITGIRLLPVEAGNLSAEYLYVDRMAEVVTDKRFSGDYVLLNRHDRILVTGYTFDELINVLLSIFEFYNAWESRLLRLAAETGTLQEIADACQEVFENPLVIMEHRGKMLAVSSAFGPDAFDADWEYIRTHMVVPPGNLAHAIIDRTGRKVDFWTAVPQIYLNRQFGGADLIGVILEIDNEERGALCVFGYRRSLGEVDLQLSKIVSDVLCRGAYFNSHEIRTGQRSYVLSSLLAGETIPPEALASISELPGVRPPWKLAALRNIYRNDDVHRYALLRLTMEQRDACLAFSHDGLILVIASQNNLPGLLDALMSSAGSSSYTAGVSLPFSDMTGIPVFYQQALFALSHAGTVPGLYDFVRYAFEHLLSLMRRQNDALMLTHPALAALAAYDEKNETALGLTLYQYLLNERSILKTAEALYLHRNSLMYRIRRIEEILGVDLENETERIYILLSYLLTRGEAAPG